MEIVRHKPIVLRIYFAPASHLARLWGSGIVCSLNAIFFGERNKKCEPKFLESQNFCHYRDHLLTIFLGFHWNNRILPQVLGVLCFGEDKQGLSSFIWSVSASWRLSNSGSSPSFISSIRLGIKNKPANSVKMGDVWLLRNSNCFKCGSQQSNVPLQDEITASCAHSLCELHSICMGESQGMSSLKEWRSASP